MLKSTMQKPVPPRYPAGGHTAASLSRFLEASSRGLLWSQQSHTARSPSATRIPGSGDTRHISQDEDVGLPGICRRPSSRRR